MRKLGFTVLILIWFSPVYSQNYKLVDSIKRVLKTSISDSVKVNLYLKWDNEVYLSDPAMDEYLNKQIVRIAKKNLQNNSVTKHKVNYYNKFLSTAYNNLGLYYSDRGVYDIALEHYNKALIIREQLKDDHGIATTLNNIGLIYKDLNSPDEAIKFYKRALKIMRKLGDSQSESTCLNNIGILYMDNLLNYDSALFYYDQSLAISIRNNNISGQARTLNNIALVDVVRKDYKGALEKAFQSYDLRVESLDVLGQNMSLSTICSVYFDKGDDVNAELYGIKSLELGQKVNAPFEVMSISNLLYRIYKRMGKFEKALAMHELYRDMDLKIASDKNNRSLLAQQVQYEYAKKSVADSIAFAQKKLVDDARFQSERTKRNFLYFGIGLLVVFVFFVLNRLRVTRKQKRIIEHQKLLVEEKQREVMDSMNYAKRIQSALMPNDKSIEKMLNKRKRN